MRWSRADIADRLERLERGARTLILMHDFPDPDSLAAAAGLGRLLDVTRRHEVVIGFGGFVGRAENQQMVKLLRIPGRPVETLDIQSFRYVGIVDSQHCTGNNALPASRRPDIVVDHHPELPSSAGIPWLDIRVDVGATATIILEYLRQMGVPLGPHLATALYYAVKTETHDLVRETHEDDVEAYRYLLPRVDRSLLAGILDPPVAPEYFQLLSRAVERSRIQGNLLVVDLQNVPFPEIVAEIADLMLRHEGIDWVLALGQHGDDVYLSMRTRQEEIAAGELLRKVVAEDGRAGGHGTMAGGRMPAADLSAARAAINAVIGRLVHELGLEDVPMRGI